MQSYHYCKWRTISQWQYLEKTTAFSFSLFAFQNVPAALYTDPNEIAQHLTLKLTECEKLELPETGPHPRDTEAPQ